MVLTIFNEKDGFNMMPVIDHPKKHITTDINTGKNQYLPRAVMPCNHSCAKLEASTSRLGEGMPLAPNNDYMMIDNNIQDRDAGLYFAAPTELVPAPVPYVLPTNTELLLELEVFEDGTRRNPVQTDNNFHRRQVLQTYSNLKERGDKTSGDYGAQLKLEADKYLQINGPDIYGIIKQEEAMAEAAASRKVSELSGMGTASAIQLSLLRLEKDIEDESKENIARELDIISDSIENIRRIAGKLPSSPVNERFRKAVELLSTTDIVVGLEGKLEKDVLLNTLEKVENGTATEPEIEEITRIMRKHSGELNETLARNDEIKRLQDLADSINLSVEDRKFLSSIDTRQFDEKELVEFNTALDELTTGSSKNIQKTLRKIKSMVEFSKVRIELPKVNDLIKPEEVRSTDDIDNLKQSLSQRQSYDYAVYIGQHYHENFNIALKEYNDWPEEKNAFFLKTASLAMLMAEAKLPLTSESTRDTFDAIRKEDWFNNSTGFRQLKMLFNQRLKNIKKAVIENPKNIPSIPMDTTAPATIPKKKKLR